MKKKNLPARIFSFYVNGFKSMEWGKPLWILILVKLFIMFFVLRIFFFPRYLNQFETTEDKQEYVSEELIDRALLP